MTAATPIDDGPAADGFSDSRELFDTIVDFLDGASASGLTHADLESRLSVDGRELLRQLFQDHLDLRAERETRLSSVVDAHGVARGAAEPAHERRLTTVFGDVHVARIAYRQRGHANLHPADAGLNLPAEQHSHGLRALAAVEASRGSFDDTAEAVKRVTGTPIGKRQVEELAGRAAVDFDAFYLRRRPAPAEATDVLVLTCDGKGIVMRPDGLRPATAKASASSDNKLEARLSKGEKRNRKRIAEVAAVYDATPVVRRVADIFPDDKRRDVTAGPVAANKWLVASIVDGARTVIGQAFDEAERRDPGHIRPWVALVDGANHQIEVIETEARKRHIKVTIMIDLVHVLEYLWKAAWSFFDEGDTAAQTWVHDNATKVLNGTARQVAAAIRRRATQKKLTATRRKGADTCANYLTAKSPYLDYPAALASGWPIATGVIEGACRHLVKDRMDLTGARWGLTGAESVLKLRALRTNGDWDQYLKYHLTQEQSRVHRSKYEGHVIPTAA